MKRTLKSNKGFSLVELIVVVLIMAIIAVALAPQIMKWVENSRISTDASTYDTLVENLQIAAADEGVLKAMTGKSAVYTIGSNVTVTGEETALEEKMNEIYGANDWKTKVKKKASAGSSYQVTLKVDAAGAASVTRDAAPNGDSVGGSATPAP